VFQSKLKSVRRLTLYEQIFEEMKRFILDNDLQPGDRLPTERQMAETLSVSRHSVREALKSLEFMGVLNSSPKIGYTVLPFSLRSIADHVLFRFPRHAGHLPQLLEARQILETIGIDMCVANAKEWHFDRLERLVHLAADNIHDPAVFEEACTRVWDGVFEGSGNELLACIFEIVYEFFHRATAELAELPLESREARLGWLSDLVEALIDHDAAKAKLAAQRNIDWLGEPEVQGALSRSLLPGQS